MSALLVMLRAAALLFALLMIRYARIRLRYAITRACLPLMALPAHSHVAHAYYLRVIRVVMATDEGQHTWRAMY